MLLGGILFVVMSFQEQNLAREVANWPATKGTIVESAYDTDHDGSDTTYTINVRYTFEVNGKEYVGTKLFPGNSRRGYGYRRNVEKALESYPKDQEVTVYYDPEQPGRAGLLREPEMSEYFTIAIGMLFALIGLCGTLFSVWLLIAAPKARFAKRNEA